MTVIDSLIVPEGLRSVDAIDMMVHDVDSRRHQVCVDYPAEQLDSYRTSFAKGCFADSFRENPHMPMLVEHDRNKLIGHSISAQSLTSERVHRVVAQFSDLGANPLAKQYFAHIRDGDLPGGWSYHFDQAQGQAHPSGLRSAVRYTKARMREFGPTVAAAIPNVVTSGLRSDEGGYRSAEELRAALQGEDAWHKVREMEQRELHRRAR